MDGSIIRTVFAGVVLITCLLMHFFSIYKTITQFAQFSLSIDPYLLHIHLHILSFCLAGQFFLGFGLTTTHRDP